MNCKRLFWVLVFTLAVVSCRQNVSGSYDYSSLKFDTSKINIFQWNSSLSAFPKYSERLFLTNDDINIADSLLTVAVDSFNQTKSKLIYESFNRKIPIDSFKIDLTKFKRQYFPYKDNNGERILQLVCFPGIFPPWRNKVYNYHKYREGFTVFRLKVNLSKRTADHSLFGGY